MRGIGLARKFVDTSTTQITTDQDIRLIRKALATSSREFSTVLRDVWARVAAVSSIGPEAERTQAALDREILSGKLKYQTAVKALDALGLKFTVRPQVSSGPQISTGLQPRGRS